MRGEDDEGADGLVALPGAPAPAVPRRPPEFERLLTEVIVSGGPRLLRLAASFCPADAEDILNIATERALGRPEAFAHGNPGQLYRWLERTVRNECLKTLRARRREQLTDPAELHRAAADPAAQARTRSPRPPRSGSRRSRPSPSSIRSRPAVSPCARAGSVAPRSPRCSGSPP